MHEEGGSYVPAESILSTFFSSRDLRKYDVHPVGEAGDAQQAKQSGMLETEHGRNSAGANQALATQQANAVNVSNNKHSNWNKNKNNGKKNQNSGQNNQSSNQSSSRPQGSSQPSSSSSNNQSQQTPQSSSNSNNPQHPQRLYKKFQQHVVKNLAFAVEKGVNIMDLVNEAVTKASKEGSSDSN